MDVAQVRHVAELAELSLTEDEEKKLAVEIGRIVDYVKELERVDTTGVPPTAHALGIVPARAEEGWRADEPVAGLSHEDALAAAPRAEHDGFSVPTFVDAE
jgi:aspartyl-tRNA(Asn)/glutamyl-tRNA(Gln) amidotransferase subunit C